MNHIHNEVDPQAYVNLIADCPAEKSLSAVWLCGDSPQKYWDVLKR